MSHPSTGSGSAFHTGLKYFMKEYYQIVRVTAINFCQVRPPSNIGNTVVLPVYEGDLKSQPDVGIFFVLHLLLVSNGSKA